MMISSCGAFLATGAPESIDGGIEAAWRSDGTSGSGWSLLGSSHFFAGSVSISLSVCSYEGTEATRLSIGQFFSPDSESGKATAGAGIPFFVGLSISEGETGEWGVGPAAGIGIGAFGPRVRGYVMCEGHASLGEDTTGGFRAVAEAALRGSVGLQF